MRTILVISALVALATARGLLQLSKLESELSKLENKRSYKRSDSTDTGVVDVTGWIKLTDGCYFPPTFTEVIPFTDVEYTISLDKENADKLQELLDLFAVFYEMTYGEPTTDYTVSLWPGCENLNAEVAENVGRLIESMENSKCDAKGDDNKGGEDNDNAGGEGTNNKGGEVNNNADGEGNDNAGSEGNDNAGSEGNDNAGSEGNDNAGSEGNDNAGSEGNDNAGGQNSNQSDNEDDGSMTSLERLFSGSGKKRSTLLHMFKKLAVKLQKKK